jgi:hypothetical protein
MAQLVKIFLEDSITLNILEESTRNKQQLHQDNKWHSQHGVDGVASLDAEEISASLRSAVDGPIVVEHTLFMI